MGRPLRAKYSGGVAIGVQEMSDDEIADIILPKLVNYAVANPDSVYGTKLRINGSGTYDVVRGTFYDYRTSSFAGEHPVTYNLINTYNFTQNERTITPSVSARPVHHVTVGNEQRILEMSDTDIYSYLLPTTISRLTYYGSGSYVITQTNAGPGSLGWSGTWVSIGTFVDTYWIASSLTSVSYTLWQRTDTISVGTTYRPLKQVLVSGEQRLVEMTDLEIESLYVFIGESIRTTGVGQYSFSTSAPAQGTWANLGSAIDRLNIAIDTNYTGYYSGTYVGSYTGLYSGSYQSTFVGQYGNTFTALYTGIYNLLTPFTGQYAGTYNQAFTGAFSGAYTGAFSGLYNSTYSAVYPGSYTGAYNQAFTGAFTGGYIIYFTGVYAGTYTGILTVYHTLVRTRVCSNARSVAVKRTITLVAILARTMTRTPQCMLVITLVVTNVRLVAVRKTIIPAVTSEHMYHPAHRLVILDTIPVVTNVRSVAVRKTSILVATQLFIKELLRDSLVTTQVNIQQAHTRALIAKRLRALLLVCIHGL